MLNSGDGLRAWMELALVVTSSFPPHVDVCIPRDLAPHPEEAGLRRTLGLGRGRHYALPLPDGGRLHVRVRGDNCYLAHWDVRDPHRDPLGHLLLDSPDLMATLTGALSTALEVLRGGLAGLGSLGEILLGGAIAGFMLSRSALLLIARSWS